MLITENQDYCFNKKDSSKRLLIFNLNQKNKTKPLLHQCY